MIIAIAIQNDSDSGKSVVASNLALLRARAGRKRYRQRLIAIQNISAAALSTKPFQSSPPISHREPSASNVSTTIAIQVTAICPNESPEELFPATSREAATLLAVRAKNGASTQNPQSVNVRARALA